MRQDDEFDAKLTGVGVEQAKSLHAALPKTVLHSIQLVVASSLTRAIQTADIVFPAHTIKTPRISLEVWREVSGLLLNAHRQTRAELRQAHKDWNFDEVETEDDVLWTPEALEDASACAERAYQALCWAWEREEECIGIVAHGGILSFLLNEPGHPQVSVSPEAKQRFHNCEMRSYVLEQRISQSSSGNCSPQLEPSAQQEQDKKKKSLPMAFTISPLSLAHDCNSAHAPALSTTHTNSVGDVQTPGSGGKDTQV